MPARDASADPPPPDRREALAREVAKEEANLRRLDAEHREAGARLAVLRRELATLEAAHAPTPAPEPAKLHNGGPRTSAEKVKLFRQLFRGRPDLYPTRFVS